MNDSKPKELATPAAKHLMALFTRGLTATTQIHPNQQGTRPRLRNGKRRDIRFPSPMHRKEFAVTAGGRQEQKDFYRICKAAPGCHDVMKGQDGEKLYVVWNGKLG